eukprot:6134010-Alexandrium_andersonii.AAC.1
MLLLSSFVWGLCIGRRSWRSSSAALEVPGGGGAAALSEGGGVREQAKVARHREVYVKDLVVHGCPVHAGEGAEAHQRCRMCWNEAIAEEEGKA